MEPGTAVPEAGAAPVGDAAQPEGAFPSQYDASGMTSFDKVEMDLRGAHLTIVCAMPGGGGDVTVKCNMGHDVAYAKGQLSRATDIAYDRIKLFFEGKLMFDPLSFNDFPNIRSSTDTEIRVDVTIEPGE